MKIKAKISFLFSSIIFIYIALCFIILIFMTNFYLLNKENELDTYVNSGKTIDEIVEYANNLGYIVTISSENYEIIGVAGEDTSDTEVETYRVDSFYDTILLNEQNTTYTYSYSLNGIDYIAEFQMNMEIIKEFTYFLVIIMLIIFVLFIVMIVIILIFISKKVVKPANEIINYVQTDKTNYKFKKHREFNKIYEAISGKNELIMHEKEVNKNLVRALTHELKTPLSQIGSLLFLHKRKAKGFEDINFIEEEVSKIIEENEQFISNFLKTYSDITKQEDINITNLINSIIDTATQLEVTLNIDEMVIHENELMLSFILTNILSNAQKYAKTYINITLKNNILTIENDYDKTIEKGNGKKIIKNFTEVLNIKHEVIISDGIYVDKINFINYD